ncbi:hypothetical protein OOK60_09300 [Trichothermofontia sichuanensis B231]|uniref:hypothetical protein n=1 Tax=Trichothermofontia sichuanensis TaxID=3045816 RepID=UPI0022456030|nr:hypothetical protein [Trichothermofontia sichuanensis]UZQ56222.1 hypothetical protein OOK60_09300 [Trichothermofontia sichuanensis B231]
MKAAGRIKSQKSNLNGVLKKLGKVKKLGKGCMLLGGNRLGDGLTLAFEKAVLGVSPCRMGNNSPVSVRAIASLYGVVHDV